MNLSLFTFRQENTRLLNRSLYKPFLTKKGINSAMDNKSVTTRL